MKSLLSYLCFIFILTSCKKENEVSDKDLNGRDSSLLFGLNIVDKALDSSVYQCRIEFNNTSPRFLSENGINLLEFGTEVPYTPNPANITISIPVERLSNEFTIFFELKNTVLSNNPTYYGQYDHYYRGGLSNIQNGNIRITDDLYFVSERYIMGNETNPYPGMGVDYKSASTNCFGGSQFYSHTSSSTQLGTTEFLKGAVVFKDRNSRFYINGQEEINFSGAEPIKINACGRSDQFSFEVARGTLLKKMYIYNRALSKTEVQKL